MSLRLKEACVWLVFSCFLLAFVPAWVHCEERVIAVVADKKITFKDLEHEIKRSGKLRSFQARLDTLSPEGKRKIFDAFIKAYLFSEAAKREGIELDPGEKWDLERLRMDLIVRKYIRSKLKIGPVTETEMRVFYEKNKDRFIIPGKRKLRHIVVRTNREAEDILGDLKKGKDFAEMAGKVNIDATKEKQGDLGWVKKGVMVKAFEDAAFGMKKGEISGVVRTPFGFHVIKAEAIKKQEMKLYRDVKRDLRRKVESEKLKKLEAGLRKALNLKIDEQALKEGLAEKGGEMKKKASGGR